MLQRHFSAKCLINTSNFGEEPARLKASCFTGRIAVSSFFLISFPLSLSHSAICGLKFLKKNSFGFYCLVH